MCDPANDSPPKIGLGSNLELPAPPSGIPPAQDLEPEKHNKPWERILWIFGLVGGISAFYSTWITSWTFINGRRDLILGIGQKDPLSPDLANIVLWHDWVPTACGFCVYAVAALSIIWWFIAKCKPMQDAVLNPFGHSKSQKADDKSRVIGTETWRVILVYVTTILVIAGILLTFISCYYDYTSIQQFMNRPLPKTTTSPTTVSVAFPTNSGSPITQSTNDLPTPTPPHP